MCMGNKYCMVKNKKKELCNKKWEISRKTEQMLMLYNANYAMKEPHNEKVT